jgi:hypothetical protein
MPTLSLNDERHTTMDVLEGMAGYQHRAMKGSI